MAGETKAPGRRALASSALAVTLTNGITAGGSLVLQIVAARQLGLVGYGAFALCTSILATVLSVYTGYVGDALTVMDRHSDRIRPALVTSGLVGLVVAFLIGVGAVLLLHIGTLAVALVYASMLVLWLVEEIGRRLLIARLRYWRLVANDGTYMGVTLVVLVASVVAGLHLTLLLMLASMLVGCLSAVCLALIQLPSSEYRCLRLGRHGHREVARFAVWRSLQMTVRQVQLLGSRVLVRQLVSLSTVGAVEAGRLVIAPLQTVLSGAGDFLLSTGAEGKKSNRGLALRSEQASIVLFGMSIVFSLVATALAHPLGQLMTGHRQPPMLVLGWGVYTCMWAASLPFTTELAVRQLSLPVFRARLVEACTGLVLVAVVLSAGPHYIAVPWLLAAPGLVNTWYLRRVTIRTRK